MAGPKRSLEVWRNGQQLTFPTYDDLVDYLNVTGVVQSRGDLLDGSVHLLGNVLLSWIRSGQVGCQFAAKLSRTPQAAAWESMIVPDWDDPRLPWHLEATLTYLAPAWNAVQLVFPGVVEPEHAARLVGNLCAHPQWEWEEVGWRECSIDGCFLCGLRWRIPDSDKRSFVLGIGPFDPLPVTRRFEGAPFSALIFRPRPDAYTPFVDLFPAGADEVHLASMPPKPADVPDRVDERAWVDRTNARTVTNRKLLLSGDGCEEAGKAKVTFCLPERVRELLGPSAGSQGESHAPPA